MRTLRTAMAACSLLLLVVSQTTAQDLGPATQKTFLNPDEVRDFANGKLELVKIGGVTIGRATFLPGWRWSTSLKEAAKTESCEAPHFQYHVSGVLHIQMDDGKVLECKAGDVSYLPSGHDAWVVGEEPVVVVDWHGMLDYATKK